MLLISENGYYAPKNALAPEQDWDPIKSIRRAMESS
jgi:hypothetical protein